MVRAELGNGNREAAEALLLRVQDRSVNQSVFFSRPFPLTIKYMILTRVAFLDISRLRCSRG